MIDVKKKLNHKCYIDWEKNVQELIQHILDWGWEFYYKNISYTIDLWADNIYVIQTNSHEDDCDVKYAEFSFEGTMESALEAFETFKLHDGTTLYEAVTKRGYDKYFGYDKNAKY